jgi:hypothetical protein
MQPPQVPVLRKAAAAVAIFMVAPVLVPPAPPEYPAQVPVRRQAFQYDSTVIPPTPIAPPFDPALFVQYPPQVPVRRPAQQFQSTFGPVFVETEPPVVIVIDVGLIPDGGCPGDTSTNLIVGAPNSAASQLTRPTTAALQFGVPVGAQLRFGQRRQRPHVDT